MIGFPLDLAFQIIVKAQGRCVESLVGYQTGEGNTIITESNAASKCLLSHEQKAILWKVAGSVHRYPCFIQVAIQSTKVPTEPTSQGSFLYATHVLCILTSKALILR